MKTNLKFIHSLITIFLFLFAIFSIMLGDTLENEPLQVFGGAVAFISLLTIPNHWVKKLEALGKEAGRVTQQHN